MPRFRRLTRSRGASALEFALVLPLLLLLVMGILDWGYYFFAEQIVVNAAREGARAGSLATLDSALAQAEATSVASEYLTRAGLDATRAVVATTVGADSVAVAITFPTGSLTGLSTVIVPSAARATAEMRR
ncbi:MAG TPA: TadE family protein [Myxococcales bacterium]|jgi:Flp pilus assembly protein TadG